ncbi:MAG: hypothetical protein ABW173_03935 [Sphingomonas sp.]
MVSAVFDLLIRWWPIPALLLVAVSWWLGRRPRAWSRHAAMLLLVLLAPLLIVLEGLVTGCAIRPDGARCYWFGFGLAVSMVMIVPSSALLVATGAACARWPRRG